MRVFDSRDTMALYRSVHAFWQFAGKYFPFILFSEKGILPMEHDFSGSVRAVTWENPPQTKEEALEAHKAVSAALCRLPETGRKLEGELSGILPGEEISAINLRSFFQVHFSSGYSWGQAFTVCFQSSGNESERDQYTAE